jgi:hypothetical protein
MMVMDMTSVPLLQAPSLVDRYAQLIRELMPMIKHHSPELTYDEQVIVAARMAECRLADEGDTRKRKATRAVPLWS